MTDGVSSSDTFDRTGTLGGDYLKNARWNAPKPSATPSVKCKACGHTVTLQPGESIPYGDPRLCEHMGQKP